MSKVVLKPARGYDPRTQAKIGWLAAQMDDQLKWLKKAVKGLTVKQLEWQLRPGMNTVGMLLAHLAIVDLWWITLASKGALTEEEWTKLSMRVCGFADDGIPLGADGKHPAYIKGYSVEKYIGALTKVRRLVHKELKKWRDRDLEQLYSFRKSQFSKSWTLYHVHEHFCGHHGQVLLLKHMMRDAGVLREKKK
jgi:uncharacterized damage-inducible protein DinB